MLPAPTITIDVGSPLKMGQHHRMPLSLAMTALLVDDYDDAISFFVGCLGFVLRQDAVLGGGKRWVVVAPAGAACGLLLARAVGERQRSAVGDQSGGRVFLFLETDDFCRDHHAFTERGVRFVEAPRREDYGTVAVFEDLYGNRWDLIGPAVAPTVRGIPFAT